jgi:hypothetical protein
MRQFFDAYSSIDFLQLLTTKSGHNEFLQLVTAESENNIKSQSATGQMIGQWAWQLMSLMKNCRSSLGNIFPGLLNLKKRR